VTTQYVNEAENCDQVALISDGHLVALAEPDELRREATGGDVIEIETAVAFDAPRLAGLPSVRSVSQSGPRTFRVTVDEAGAATPAVVEAIGEGGIDVVSASEYRPSFDEIFATLVARDRERRGVVDRSTSEALDREAAA
jgi:ABC-2 type transport system ATP-binding protein